MLQVLVLGAAGSVCPRFRLPPPDPLFVADPIQPSEPQLRLLGNVTLPPLHRRLPRVLRLVRPLPNLKEHQHEPLPRTRHRPRGTTRAQEGSPELPREGYGRMTPTKINQLLKMWNWTECLPLTLTS